MTRNDAEISARGKYRYPAMARVQGDGGGVAHLTAGGVPGAVNRCIFASQRHSGEHARRIHPVAYAYQLALTIVDASKQHPGGAAAPTTRQQMHQQCQGGWW